MSFVTTLPSSPVDGQEVYYQSTTAGGGGTNTMADVGAVWHLRYRAASSSAYKWEFVGGTSISHSAPGGTTGAGGTFAALASGSAPVIVLPVAGDYILEYGENSVSNVNADGQREANMAPVATGLTAGTAGSYGRLLLVAGHYEKGGAHFQYRATGISGTATLHFLSATYPTIHTLLYLTVQPIRVS